MIYLVAFSAVSFVFFGLACLKSEKMHSEFARYGLNRWRTTVGTLQLLGAAGLLVGFWSDTIAAIASAGLMLIMFLGVYVRLKIHDTPLQTLPALFYMVLNAWIFINLISGN